MSRRRPPHLQRDGAGGPGGRRHQGLHQAAAATCERLLGRNPTDDQGVRMILDPIRDGEPWEDDA